MFQASRRNLTIRAFIRTRHSAAAHFRRSFALNASSQSTLSFRSSDFSGVGHAPIAHVDSGSSVGDDYVSRTRQQKYDDLLDSLNREETNPNWTWAYYADLLDFTRDEELPLEIHQRVLRKCTPDIQEVRAAFARRLRERHVLQSPHRHESRFLAVINNIRKAGLMPALDDYEFILTNFAAVGHYIGAAQVLQEIIKSGLQPRTKTFGLCLQAIAYRLSLPCPESQQAELRELCSQLCLHIVEVIRKRKQGLPSACLDLTLRIMKDTDNASTFTSLLKFAYGIDLDYLDRHPLASDGALESPEPFSTAALTTLVDFLGRQKQVSKMVAAFEVLSTPLNIGSSEIQLRNFDDDDDDNYFIPDSSSTPRPLPSAQPNTTTFNTLIRHCTRLRKTALAKHYMLRALELGHSSSIRLESDIQTFPLAGIRPPRVLVNVDTFRPILGLGNRNYDVGLIKWLLPHFRKALRRKKRDLQHYSSVLDQPGISILQPVHLMSPSEIRCEYESARPASSNFPTKNPDVEIPPALTTRPPTEVFTPSSPPSSLQTTSALLDGQVQQSSSEVAFEPPSLAGTPRPFDLALHVHVLQRDILTMKKLDGRIGAALSRLHIRRKEALGRRIWAGRTVYVRDVNKRMKVSRMDWMEIVNFGGATSRPLARVSSRTPELHGESTAFT